jgi:hypothetical protein
MPAIVSYCVTVKNRGTNLRRLCESLRNLHKPGPMELIIADYVSSDLPKPRFFEGLPYPVMLLTLTGGNFNRAQGLNIAAKHDHAKGDAPLFFIDADLIVPADFNDRVRDIVKPNICWFPICYSMHNGKPITVKGDSRRLSNRTHGWWRKEGKGMCGFTRTDFDKVGWNDRVGVTYGKEDGSIWRAATKIGKMHGVRENCDGLFHLWHPTVNSYRTKHHRKGGGKKRRGKDQVNPVPVIPTVSVQQFNG